jgi:hypothetical protein
MLIQKVKLSGWLETVEGHNGVREAVNALNADSDRLVSRSLLLEADHFRMKDADIDAMRENCSPNCGNLKRSDHFRNQDCRYKGSSPQPGNKSDHRGG